MTRPSNPDRTGAVRRDAYGTFAAAIAVSLLGCNDLEVCGSSTQDVTRDDGEVYRCVTSEDCPRTSRVNLCVTDVSPVAECVRCEETKCVSVIPESC